MTAMQLGAFGGVFAVLVFWHFFADWVFQSHKEAMAKVKDWHVRFGHCLLYTALFVPLFWFVDGFSGSWAAVAAGLILFFSHFVIDTYIPVMLWAKWLRRAPQFKDVVPSVILTKEQVEGLMKGEGKVVGRGWSDRGIDSITYKSDEEAFRAFFMTPVGAILCITMDQLFHIAFLLPVAWLMVRS